MTSQISVSTVVALRKESVDRNWLRRLCGVQLQVALRKESVDRNALCARAAMEGGLSLSARRAWIEMMIGIDKVSNQCVALRKESVDRNRISGHLVGFYSVALRKESVDRNRENPVNDTVRLSSLSARRAWIEISKIWYCGTSIGRRSPQGERG